MVPYIRGLVAPQAHVDVPEGTVEEEYGRSGFFGRYAHLYRTEAPVGWTRIEGALKPRAYNLTRLENEHLKRSDYLRERVALLSNSDVRIIWANINTPMDCYFRNADGDEVLFVHNGSGTLQTDFGPLKYKIGDYLVIPRGTVYRLVPKTASSFLIIESFSEVRLPNKGMLGQHALFDPAVIQVPTPEAQPGPLGAGDFELKIKREGEISSVFYPFSPLNTVGWKGDLTVWQLNISDIRPVSCDRYHLPPSAHTTFVADDFVICTFLPRPLENGDPGAMKVPFYHSNIDYDEVIFYHSGEFFSRGGILPGHMTFHPQGIHHGPQRSAITRSKDVTNTIEQAVMIDTRRPLKPDRGAGMVELQDYWRSWQD